MNQSIPTTHRWSANVLCLLLCLFAVIGLQAQPSAVRQARQPVRIDPAKDRQEYRGLTIRLFSTVEGHYGFAVLQGETLVMHLVNELQPGKPLDKREDAFAAARGLADQYLSTGKVPPLPQPTRHRPQPSQLPNPAKP